MSKPKGRRKPSLTQLVDEWLAKNHPHLCIEENSIILQAEKGKISKAYGVVLFGRVKDDGIQISLYYDDFHTDIAAADPEFFSKLDKHLRQS
jgi:hypothetical protein